VRGVSLAVVTFAVGWAIEEVWFNNESFNGGFTGATVPRPTLFGIDLSFTRGTDVGTMPFCIMLLIVVVLVGFAVVNLRRSDTGRRMLAVRSNERAAAAAGVHVARTKFIAFGVSAFIAGLGGTLIGYQQSTLSPSSFDVLVSVSFLAVAYLGGISSVAGAVVGGTMATGGLGFYIIDQLVLNHVNNGLDLQGAVAGIGLILTAILNQEGVAGALRDQMVRLRRSRKPGSTKVSIDAPVEELGSPNRLPVGDGAPS
jgi:ABC-type branched-subunit amino acid transport system permease subunit